MAMGQQKDRQGDLMVSWSEMPRSPGHVFYDRLQSVWTCRAKVPDTYLIYTATVSNPRGLFPPSVECLRRGL